MNKYLKHILPAAALALAATMVSCTGDLDLKDGAIDPNLTTLDSITPEQMFNKCYAVIGVAGNGGANGDCDVDGIDGGTSGYVRQMWNANELTTDEAICCWGDDGIPQFNYNTYDANHPMLAGFYYRLYTAIAFDNHYLENFSDYDEMMTAEVRFLRALSYYFLMDGWGNVPFTTTVSATPPRQAPRREVYEFVESELLEVLVKMHAPIALKDGQDDGHGWKWGRCDQDCANLLLARLYLNSEVYIGEARYDKAALYAKKVMDGPHHLNMDGYTYHKETPNPITGIPIVEEYHFSAYQMLFMGDNDVTSAAAEAVFPILQDGTRTTSWGTSLFMMASTFDGDMHESVADPDATNGTDQAWGGNRARPELVRKFFPLDNAPADSRGFQTAEAAHDDRALFNTVGRTLDCDPATTFKNGYAIAKYTNFKTDLSAGHNATFPDGDFFLLRSAEAYLTYAEALTRQSGNADATPVTGAALEAVKKIRARANAADVASFTLRQLLDEWSREFYFEGRRRIDLIRFGQFGGNASYTWQWKGGKKENGSFEAYRNIFAIPTNDRTVNTALVQNPGYAQ